VCVCVWQETKKRISGHACEFVKFIKVIYIFFCCFCIKCWL